MEAFILKGTVCYSTALTELTAHPDAYLVCVDGISQGVFPVLPERYRGLPITDFGDALILPGLVDLHIHAPQYTFRGTGMDLALLDWLQLQAFPEETKYAGPDYTQGAYRQFAQQMKGSATTRACVFGTPHRASTVTLMEELEATGLVTYVGKVNMDRNAPDGLRETSAEVSARETLGWLEDIAGKFRRTKPILTPRFIPSCTDELMAQLQTIQETYRLPVQSHLSENPEEIRWVKELCPEATCYGDAYDRWGLFGRDRRGQAVPTIMAHCVWSVPEEVETMGENGVFVAHCPASNTNLASGIAPVRRYLDAGLRVGLGSDVAGGHSESIFRAITDAVQVSKLYWRLVDKDARPLTFPEAFFLATRGGGAFFGRVGSFDPGYGFDAIVLDDSHLPHLRPLTPLQRLEQAAYLSADLTGLKAKYTAGRRLF